MICSSQRFEFSVKDKNRHQLNKKRTLSRPNSLEIHSLSNQIVPSMTKNQSKPICFGRLAKMNLLPHLAHKKCVFALKANINAWLLLLTNVCLHAICVHDEFGYNSVIAYMFYVRNNLKNVEAIPYMECFANRKTNPANYFTLKERKAWFEAITI